jgi:hypothetical protein
MCHNDRDDYSGNCPTCSRYCDDCADEHLKSMAGWAAKLQAREGEDAVDADVITRLLEAASLEGSDDEEQKCMCEECALTCAAAPSAEAEPEEQDVAAAAN